MSRALVDFHEQQGLQVFMSSKDYRFSRVAHALCPDTANFEDHHPQLWWALVLAQSTSCVHQRKRIYEGDC
jgi:hypothetical protein